MTRTRNTAFLGTTPPDADADVPSYTTVLREIVQDANLLYDKLTGENGIAADQVIKKDGYVGEGTVKTGPPLRRCVANQELSPPANVSGADLDTYRAFSVAEADMNTYGGWCFPIAVPFFVPTGETDYWLDVVMISASASGLSCEIRDSTWALHSENPMTNNGTESGQDGAEVHSTVLQFPTSGQFYLLIKAFLGEKDRWLLRWRCYPNRTRTQDNPSPPVAQSNTFPTGRAASPYAFETIHDEMIADNEPINGWVLTTLNRNVNWLIEYASGAPVPGNATRALSDANHMHHTQAVFGSEGELEFVLWTEALGATLCDNGKAVIDDTGNRGCLSWPAIIPTFTGTTRHTFHRIHCFTPTFSAALKIRVLAVNDSGKGVPTEWDLRVSTGAGSSTAVAFTRLATSRFYTAVVTDTPYDQGVSEEFLLELHRASVAAVTHGEIQIVGVQFFYDP